MREFKSLAVSNVKAESVGRVRVGYAAIHGNVDSYDDRSHLGSFSKTLAENLKRVKHLWNHNSMNPPIASVIEVKEVGAEEMPAEILAQFPPGTITGGLKVSREYYDNDLASWVLEGIDKGDISEMSYAYDVVKSNFTDEELPNGGTRRIRELLEIRLYETSDVLWGANSATVAAGAKSNALLPLGTIYENFLGHLQSLKAGRRNSETDLVLIKQMHKIAVDLGAECVTEETDEDTPKSSNEPEKKEAEAADSTSLNSDWLMLQKAKTKIK